MLRLEKCELLNLITKFKVYKNEYTYSQQACKVCENEKKFATKALEQITAFTISKDSTIAW